MLVEGLSNKVWLHSIFENKGQAHFLTTPFFDPANPPEMGKKLILVNYGMLGVYIGVFWHEEHGKNI